MRLLLDLETLKEQRCHAVSRVGSTTDASGRNVAPGKHINDIIRHNERLDLPGGEKAHSRAGPFEPKIIRSYEPSSSDNATSKRHGGIRDASMSLHSFNSDIRDHQSDEPKFRSIYAARFFFPELAQLVELDLEKPWPTGDSVCVSAWAPVALADAVASPLAFTAREPEMALAMASRPHKFFASA